MLKKLSLNFPSNLCPESQDYHLELLKGKGRPVLEVVASLNSL